MCFLSARKFIGAKFTLSYSSKCCFGSKDNILFFTQGCFPDLKHWVNDVFFCSDTGKTTVPQAISFGKQMVDGGSSFHERASSDIKHYSRDNHILKISTIPKAWHDKSWHTGEEQSDSVWDQQHTELPGTRSLGWVKETRGMDCNT